MASLKFTSKHNYLLTTENIDLYVLKKKIGNYALGYLRNAKFIPKYVGRSDNDLNDRLKKYVNSNYKRFRFMYQTSAKNAFLKECENYHDFEEQLDNDIHPDKPNGTNWKCPRNCQEKY